MSRIALWEFITSYRDMLNSGPFDATISKLEYVREFIKALTSGDISYDEALEFVESFVRIMRRYRCYESFINIVEVDLEIFEEEKGDPAQTIETIKKELEIMQDSLNYSQKEWEEVFELVSKQRRQKP